MSNRDMSNSSDAVFPQQLKIREITLFKYDEIYQ